MKKPILKNPSRKSRSKKAPVLGPVAVAALAFAPNAHLSAVVYTWTAAPLSSGTLTEGSGIWDTSTANWVNASGTTTTWDNTSPADAWIGANPSLTGTGAMAGSTLTIAAGVNINVGNLTFGGSTTKAWIISGSTSSSTLTINGTLTCNDGYGTTINANTIFPNGLTKAGSALTTLTGSTSITGAIQLTGAGNLGLPQGSYASNSLSLTGGGYLVASGTLMSTLSQWTSGGIYPATGTTLYVNLNGGTGGTLVWGGATFNPGSTLTLVGSVNNGNIVVQNGIDLNGTSRTIRNGNNSSVGTVTVAGPISTSSGTAGVTFNIQNGNNATIYITGTNSYNGVTTLTGNGGKVILGNGGGTGSIANSSGLVLSSGPQFGVMETGTVTLGMPISGTGAANSDNNSLAFNGPGTVILTGSNTFTGGAYAKGGLVLDYTTQNNSKLATTGTLTLAGANLTITGNASGTTSQLLGALQLGTATTNTIVVNSGAIGGSATLNLGAITANTGASVDFTLPTNGNIITSTAADTFGMLGRWATVSGTAFAALSGTNIVAYTPTNSPNAGSWSANQNISNDSGAYTGIATTGTIGTLRFNNASVGTITISSANTLTIGDGAILENSLVGNNLQTISGGTLTALGSSLQFTQNNTANGLTIGSLISGTIAVAKGGPGTVTLSGNNSYSGGTTVSSGTLVVSGVPTGTGATTISAAMAVTGTLPATAVTINSGGSLIVGNGAGGSVNSASSITNSGSVVFNLSGSNNLTKGILGSGSLAFTGPGLLYINTAQTYTGVTTVSSGTMMISSPANPFPTANSIVVNNGGVFLFGANDPFGGSGTHPTGPVFTVNAGGTLVNGPSGGTGRYVTLPPINLNGGTLMSNNGNYIGSFALQGTITVNGTATSTMDTNDVTGGGGNDANYVIDSTAGGGVPFVVNQAAVSGTDLVVRTQVRDGNTVGSGIAKSGAGLMAITGTNNIYTGVTAVNGGILQVTKLSNAGAGSSIGTGSYNSNAAGDLAINGGTLRYVGTGDSTNRLFTVGSGGATLDAGGSGAVTFAGPGAVAYSSTGSSASLVLTGTSTAANTLGLTIGDPAAGSTSTSLTKNGAGTWAISGSNSYSGATVVNNGTLQLGNTNALGNTSGLTLSGTGAVLDLRFGGVPHAFTVPGTSGTRLTLNSGAAIDFLVTSSTTNDELVVNPGASAFMNGPITINLSTSGIPMGNYTLLSAPGGGLSSNISNFVAGTGFGGLTYSFIASGTSTILSIGNAVTLAYWKGGTVGGSANVWNAQSGSNTNWVDGSGVGLTALPGSVADVVFSGTGASNQNTVLGADLSVKSLAINDSTPVTIGGTNTLSLLGTSGTTGITVSGAAGAVVINANVALSGSSNVQVNSANGLTVNGAISGTSGLTKLGTGPLVLAGANGYTGATTISSGTLTLGAGGTTGSIVNVSNLVNNSALAINRSDAAFNYSGVLSGTGLVTVIGSGTATFSGSNAFAGNMSVSAGRLALVNPSWIGQTGSNAFKIANGATLEINVNGADIGYNAVNNVTITGTGNLVKSGANLFATQTTTAAGRLTVGLAAGGLIDIQAGTFKNSLWTNNSASLQLESSGTLNLGGAPAQFDALNGSGTILRSTLGDAAGGGDVQMTLGIANTSGTFSGSLNNPIGSVSINKNGTGTQVLTGSSNYSGNTTVNAGTLRVTNNAGLGFGGAKFGNLAAFGAGYPQTLSGTATVNAGATLDVSGITVNKPIILNGGSLVNSSGTPTLIDSGIADLVVVNTGSYSSMPTSVTIADPTGAGATATTGIASNNISGMQAGGWSVEMLTPGTGYTSPTVSVVGSGTGMAVNAILSSVTLSGSTANSIGGSGNMTIAATITGTAGFSKAGSGTLILTAPNTYSGATSINGGTLQLGDGVNNGSIANSTLSNNATLAFNPNAGGLVYSGPTITGSGSVVLLGANSVTLTSSNNYTGSTTINGGTLQVGTGGANGSIGSGPVVNNGALAFNLANSTTVPNSIGGTGSVSFTCGGAMALTGSSSYSGATTVTSGTLALGSSASLGNTAIAVAPGATFAPVPSSSAGSSGAGSAGASLVLNGATFDMTATSGVGVFALNQQSGFGGPALSGSDSTFKFNVNVAGASQLSVSGSATFAGANTISIAALGGLNPATYDLITAAGGLSGGGSFTLSNSLFGFNTLSLATTGTSEQLVVAGNSTPTLAYWTGAASSVWNDASMAPTSNWALVSGSDARQIPGAVTQVVFNSIPGAPTSLGGAVSIAGLSSTGSSGGTVYLTGGGVLTVGSGGITAGAAAAGFNLANSGIILGGNQTWRNDSAVPLTVAANVSGSASLTISGTGVVVLTGSNSNVGGTSLNGGTVQVNSAYSLGAPSNVVTFSSSGATVQLTGSAGSLSSSRNYVLNTPGTFDTNGAGNTLALSGAISGSGDLSKIGAGALILTGSNSYTGHTTITTGTLQVGDSVTDGSIASSSGITNNAALVYNLVGTQSFAGVIDGSGSLTKSGSGALVLAATNTYSGSTTIGGGTLQLGNGATTGFIANSSGITNNGVLAFNPGPSGQTLTGFAFSGTGSVLKTGANMLTMVGDTAYTGATTVNGGALILTGSQTGNGAMTVTSSGTLQVGVGGTSGAVGSATLTDHGTLIYNRSDAVTLPTVSGSGQLVQSGAGTLNVATVQTYTGPTTVNSGTLSITSVGSLYGGTAASSGSVTINSGGSVLFNRNDTFGNAGASPAGMLFVINAGGLLTNNATINTLGPVTLNGGTLESNGGFFGTSFSLRGSVTVGGTSTSIITSVNPAAANAGFYMSNNGTTFNVAHGASGTDLSVSAVLADGWATGGQIMRPSTLTKSGVGVMALSATNTYTGGTRISAGTLQAGSDAALGAAYTGGITVYINGNGTGWSSTTAATVSGGGGSGATVGVNLGLTNNSVSITGGSGYSVGDTFNLTGGGGNSAAWRVTSVDGGGAILTSALFGTGVNFTGLPTGYTSTSLTGTGAVLQAFDNQFQILGFNVTNPGSGYTSQATVSLSGGGTGSQAITNINGLMVLDGGTLQTTAGVTSPRAFQVTSNNGAIDTNGYSSKFSGPFGGSGVLTKQGAGTLALAGSNSYSGGTTINGGILDFSGTNSMPATGAVIVNSGGGIAVGIGGTGQFTTGTAGAGTIGGLLGGIGGQGTAVTWASGVTLGIDTAAASGTYSGVIADIGGNVLGLAKLGANTLAISNANTYSGPTTINAGTLQIGNGGTAGSLPSGGAISGSTGATLAFNRSNTLTQGVDFPTISGGLGVLQSGSGATVLSGNNSYSGLTTVSAGTLTLSGSNSGGGGVTLAGGQLNINNNYALGAMSGTLTIVSGTLDNTSSGDVTVANNNPQVWAGDFTYAGSAHNLNLGSGLVTMGTSRTVTVNANTLTEGGGLSGAALGLTKAGAGTLMLTGSNSYTGATTVNGGTLQIGDGTNGSIVASSPVTIATGGALTLNLGASGTFSNPILNYIGGALNVIGSGTTTIGSQINGPGVFNQNGSGLTILSGSAYNTSYGATNINAGILELSGTYTGYASTINIVNDNGLAFGVVAASIGGLSGSGALALVASSGSGVALTVGNNNFNSTYSGSISGSNGSLIKSGSATQTLLGSNSYGGATTINSGFLQIGNGGTTGSLPTGSAINGSAGGTLVFNRSDALSQGTDFSNTISGGVGILKVGTNTVTLSASNTYTGTTTAASGTLKLQGGAFTTTPRAYSIGSGGVLNLDGTSTFPIGTTTIGGSGTLMITNGNVQAASAAAILNMSLVSGGSIDVESGATITNGGWARINWANNLGGLNLNGGTLELWDGNTVVVDALTGNGTVTHSSYAPSTSLQVGVNGGSGSFGGTITETTGHQTALIKSGTGVQALTGFNSYTGATTIKAGTLQIGNGGTTGWISPSTVVTGSAGGTLAFNRSNSIFFSNNISGGIGLLQSGSGTTIVSDSNSYSGGTTVNNGTLQPGNANALGTGGLTVNGGTLDLHGGSVSVSSFSGAGGAVTNSVSGTSTLTTAAGSGTVTYAGNIADGTGSVVLTNSGAGTLILSGSLTMTGLNANSGVTQLTQSGSIGAVDVAAGATVSMVAHSGGSYNVLNVSSLTMSGFTSSLLGSNSAAMAGAGYTQVDASSPKNAGVLTDTGRALAQAAAATGDAEPGAPDSVPEPATLGMLLMGAFGLLGFRRRRANRQ